MSAEKTKTPAKAFFIIPLLAACIGVLLYFFPYFTVLEEGLYNLYFRLRPQNKQNERILLLNVDDAAIRNVGTWPWPRGYMADGLLVLKEFNAGQIIFDIEYVTKSPPALDAQYLQNGLERDFMLSFQDIAVNSSDLINAFGQGQIPLTYAQEYANELYGMVLDEQKNLFEKTKQLARDNDEYLKKAMELFGRASVTLNVQSSENSVETEAKTAAANKFSYMNITEKETPRDRNNDFVPTILPITEGARTAGFTNVTVDRDGTRRRIRIAEKIGEKWYLQLVAAPLFYALGQPDLAISNRSIDVKGNNPQDGKPFSFTIPLDRNGNMFIDWPKGKYLDSFQHLSFNTLLRYNELESYIEQVCLYLGNSPLWYLSDNEGKLAASYRNIQDIISNYYTMFDLKSKALSTAGTPEGEKYFSAWLSHKNNGFKNITEVYTALSVLLTDVQFSAENTASQPVIDAVLEQIGQVQTALENRNSAAENLAKYLENSFCIIGWTGTGTTDIGINPFDSEYINVGTHAAVVNTILNRTFIRYADLWISVLLVIVLTLPIMYVSRKCSNSTLKSGIPVVSLFVIIILSIVSFSFFGVYIGILGVTVAMLLSIAGTEIYSFISTIREKSFLQTAFGTYLSPLVIDQIIADPKKLSLGGIKRHMTAIFTDVRGFSTISEKLDPEALVSLLNRYLSILSDAVLNEQGTIDKYEGDAIIAFFGAPIEVSDHASRALRAAVAMKHAEKILNEEIMNDGSSPAPLLTRIGVNTGDMVVGNMGTKRKMDYTIMGNNVNLAARLEGVNKQYGSWILTTDATLSQTGEEFLNRRFDRVRVVGINTPVQLYEILDIAAKAKDDKKQLAAAFCKAMTLFEERKWQEALNTYQKILTEFPDDAPSRLYIGRCEKFLQNPPEKDWDGVFNLTEK